MAGTYIPDGMRRMVEGSYVSEPIWEDCDAEASGGSESDTISREDARGAHDVAVTVHNRDGSDGFDGDLYSTSLEDPNSTFNSDEWDLEATFNVGAGAQVTNRIAGPIRWVLLRGKSDGGALTDKIDVQFRKHYQ